MKNEKAYSTNSFPVAAALGFSGGLASPVCVSVVGLTAAASFFVSACIACNLITSSNSSRLISNNNVTRSFSRDSEPGLSGVEAPALLLAVAFGLGGKLGV